MSQNTQAGPVPTLGDSANVPSDMLALANALGPQLCPTFATTTARDTAAASTAFTVCTVGNVLYRKRSGAWYEVKDTAQQIGAWQNLTVRSGGIVPSGYTPQVRSEAGGTLARMWGRIQKSSGTYTGTANMVSDLPGGFVPPRIMIFSVSVDGTNTGKVYVQTDGAIRFDVVSGTPNTVILDGIAWPL